MKFYWMMFIYWNDGVVSTLSIDNDYLLVKLREFYEKNPNVAKIEIHPKGD